MDALIEEQGELQERIDAANGWELERTVEIAMDALRCPPGDADTATLSGGERRRVALCRLLLSRPDLLLLDEPTNHLDAESVAWLERFLERYEGTVVAVTHDRYFLDNVAGWILELDRGRGVPFEGNYSSWLEQKERRLALEEKQESARRRVLQRELEWVRQSPRARQAKSRARLRAYEELLAEGQRRALDTAEIVIPPGPRLGDVVIEAKGVAKAFGDRLLMEGVSFRLPPAGIVGVIGPNGAGKTTLFRMLTGEEAPDSGALRVGETVKIGAVDQSREALAADKTVWEEISGGLDMVALGAREVASRAYVSTFNFKGPDQQKKVGSLSGGERNRVHLAKMLKSGANLLLLDEPTNDLDVETLRSLEEALLPLPAPCWSSATTAGSWTGSRPTSSPSRATAMWSGSRATTPTTRPTAAAASARKPTTPTASATSRSRASREEDSDSGKAGRPRDEGGPRRIRTALCQQALRCRYSNCRRNHCLIPAKLIP